MRFIHTADWHIGLRARKLGTKGERIREERFAAGKRVIDLARAEKVDFILLAGDLFDDNAIDRNQIQKTADILRSAPCPVYVIPGNHDPFAPGSAWSHPSFKNAGNVHLLTENVPVPVPGGVLYPCPLREKKSSSDPTAWISAVSGKTVSIGIAHGSVEGCPIEEWDHPIPRDAASSRGLDYLALGHWHSMGLFKDECGAVRMAYPGTPETTKFGEENAGNALLVEIPGPGIAPQARSFETGSFAWMTVEKQLLEPGDVADLEKLVEGIPDSQNTLLRIELSGHISAEEGVRMSNLSGILESRFLWGSIDDQVLTPLPSDNGWAETLPSAFLRDVAKMVTEASVADAVKTRALFELYAMIEEE